MQNAECKMQNEGKFCVVLTKLCIVINKKLK